MGHKHVILIFVVILGIAIYVPVIIVNELPQIWEIRIGIIATATTVLGILGVLYQFSKDANLTEAEFVVNLNNNFITNEDIIYIYRHLENWKDEYLELKKKKEKENNAEPIKKEEIEFEPLTKGEVILVANYLSFFEPLYNLTNRKMVSFKTIDIMAYRFFIAVNNPHVQDMLKMEGEKQGAWTSIFSLYYKWSKERQEKVYLEQFDLMKIYKKDIPWWK